MHETNRSLPGDVVGAERPSIPTLVSGPPSRLDVEEVQGLALECAREHERIFGTNGAQEQ